MSVLGNFLTVKWQFSGGSGYDAPKSGLTMAAMRIGRSIPGKRLYSSETQLLNTSSIILYLLSLSPFALPLMMRFSIPMTKYSVHSMSLQECLINSRTDAQGWQIRLQSELDLSQMGQICDFWRWFWSHRFAPFGGNLAHFEANSDIPVDDATQV